MKKIITLSFCILAFAIANSQEETEVYKQTSGDKNLELQFDPGAIFNSSNTNNIISNGVGIRYRQFKSESIAYRANVNINYTNLNTITQDDPELKDKYKSVGISLQPGIENHFSGTKRLSPYIGTEFILRYQTSIIQSEYEWGTNVYMQEYKNSDIADGLTVGITGIAGFDFYISKKLYLGLELNYGLYYFTAFRTEYSDTNPDVVDDEAGKSNLITLQPSTIGVIRIGFLF